MGIDDEFINVIYLMSAQKNQSKKEDETYDPTSGISSGPDQT
jgi:hypothetical protein